MIELLAKRVIQIREVSLDLFVLIDLKFASIVWQFINININNLDQFPTRVE